MGGLICRLMLETDKYKGESWVAKVEEAIFVCTPHLGADRPLGFALPAVPDKDYGIEKGDMVKLLGDVRYPAGYQCMPDMGRDALYDVSHKPQVPQDIYLPQVEHIVAEKPARTACASPITREVRACCRNGQKTTTAFFFNGTTYDSTNTTKLGDGSV
jgi:hypothetical protein